jgi:hypothetical protein
MYEWFEEVGYEADVAALREEYPALTTLEGYLRDHGWQGAALAMERESHRIAGEGGEPGQNRREGSEKKAS